jgi:hypothetical protein
VLTFAIRPALFVDDGAEAAADLKARIAAEKAAKVTAKRRGIILDEVEDEES